MKRTLQSFILLLAFLAQVLAGGATASIPGVPESALQPARTCRCCACRGNDCCSAPSVPRTTPEQAFPPRSLTSELQAPVPNPFSAPFIQFFLPGRNPNPGIPDHRRDPSFLAPLFLRGCGLLI